MQKDYILCIIMFSRLVIWRRKWQPTCLENPRDGGACCAAVSGVAQSQTRLKRLSSSSRLVILLRIMKYQNKVISLIWSLPKSEEMGRSMDEAITQHLWGNGKEIGFYSSEFELFYADSKLLLLKLLYLIFANVMDRRVAILHEYCKA